MYPALIVTASVGLPLMFLLGIIQGIRGGVDVSNPRLIEGFIAILALFAFPIIGLMVVAEKTDLVVLGIITFAGYAVLNAIIFSFTAELVDAALFLFSLNKDKASKV